MGYIYSNYAGVSISLQHSKKNNVGAIVGGALGGLVFLAVLVFVAYRCGGERGNTADAKAVENATHQDNAYA